MIRHRIGKSIRRRPHRRAHGYAMTMFLIILVVITVITATLASTVTSSVEGAREASGRAEARMLAASALEAAYANILANPTEFAKAARGVANSFTTPGYPGTAAFQYLEGSAAADCIRATGAEDYTKDCVKLTIQPTDSDRVVLLTASTRVNCGGAEQSCVYADFQQRLRRAQFYDYLFFNDSASLDATALGELSTPASCAGRALSSLGSGDTACVNAIPAFTSRDTVDGAVYLRDDFVPVCGDPKFTKPVHVAGRGYRAASTVDMWASMGSWKKDGTTLRADNCSTPSTANISQVVPAPLVMRFPTAAELGLQSAAASCSAADISASFPATSVVGAALAASDLICIQPASAGSTVGLTFLGDGNVKISGSTADTPATLHNGKLLYLNSSTADIEISGSVQGQATVLTSGKARIVGNVSYAGGSSTNAFALVAGKRIVISAPTSLTEVRKIEGVLVSLSAAVAVEDWFVRNGSTATLDFNGSLAGKYRSVFGGYDDALGGQVSGFGKNFRWDSRFSKGSGFLKYLPEPKTDGWIRLDLTEVRTVEP
jgi:Tfp pilus assembly protein PilX